MRYTATDIFPVQPFHCSPYAVQQKIQNTQELQSSFASLTSIKSDASFNSQLASYYFSFFKILLLRKAIVQISLIVMLSNLYNILKNQHEKVL